jgi:hypothetical protein
MKKKIDFIVKDKIALSVLIGTGGAIALANPQPVMAQAAPPPEVKSGIDTAIATVQALNPLSQTALSVALLPFAAFLTMAFIQKVMSRV